MRTHLACLSVLVIASLFQVRPAQAETWQELLARADSLYVAAEYDSSLVVAQRALEMMGQNHVGDDTSTARALNMIGKDYLFQSKLREAETVLKRSLVIRESVLDPVHLDVAASLNNLGLVYREQGRYGEAETVLKRSLAIRETLLGPVHIDVAASLSNLAILYDVQGRYIDAEIMDKRALSIRETVLGSDDRRVAESLGELGILSMEVGRYGDAELFDKRALETFEKAIGPKHPDVARALSNLGNLYVAQRRYADAEPLYKRALDILGADPDNGNPVVAMDLGMLGDIYRAQGRVSEAESLYKRAQEIRKKVFGPEHPEVGSSLNDLALLYHEQGRYSDADSLDRLALKISETAFGPHHPNVAASLANLAHLWLDQSRYKDSELLYRRALDIDEKAEGPANPDIQVFLRYLARLAHLRGDSDKAVEQESRAWSICRENFRDGVGVMTERAALDYSQTLALETSDYLSILLGNTNGVSARELDVLHTVLSTKGIVSDEIISRYRKMETEHDSVAALLADSLRYARFALGNLYADGPGDDITSNYKAELEEATAKKDRLESELARRSPGFRRRQALWDVDAAKLSLAMPSGSVLVEYMKYDHRTGVRDEETDARYLGIVVSGDGRSTVLPLGLASSIDSAISRYRQQFQDRYNRDPLEYREAAQSLYDLVWKPVDRLCSGASTVFIAPDGELNRVSFASLMDSTGRFLIEKYPIHYVGTGRDLIRLKDNEDKPGMGLLAMGDPDYDATAAQRAGKAPVANVDTLELSLGLSRSTRPGCPALKDLKVARLPGTRQEVERISDFWKQSSQESEAVYTRESATEDKLKREAKGKRVIHLATHGYYINEACRPKCPGRDYIGENPLLLSGLLLAGSNLHGQGADSLGLGDGIVTAEEVAGLDLRGTQMVVLSACETGLGDIKTGEGVYGLRRAFQMAGARTVISALWRVPDTYTADLMSRLYAHNSQSIPELMRQAELEQIATLRKAGKSDHPFYWAGFVATGDWKIN